MQACCLPRPLQPGRGELVVLDLDRNPRVPIRRGGWTGGAGIGHQLRPTITAVLRPAGNNASRRRTRTANATVTAAPRTATVGANTVLAATNVGSDSESSIHSVTAAFTLQMPAHNKVRRQNSRRIRGRP